MTPEEAFAEAEARIAAWQPGTTLDLAITGLDRIPPSIDTLSELAVLILFKIEGYDSYTGSVADLSPLAGLTNLQTVNCHQTQIADLSPLAGLTNLKTVDCGGTQVADLSPLAGLTNLQTLISGGTHVTDLSPLAGLTNLQWLDCICTEVADLSPLAGLTNLQAFGCFATLVADLSPLTELHRLEMVDCSAAKVADLSPLAMLCGLRSLGLSFSRFSPVPDGFFERASLEEVYCYETTIEGIPSELLSKDSRDNCLPRIRAHLGDLTAGAELVRDAKVMVLGNGRVGKTQIRRRLKGEAFDPDIPSTHAIEIVPYTLTDTPEGEPAHLHLWDFGGQDIYPPHIHGAGSQRAGVTRKTL